MNQTSWTQPPKIRDWRITGSKIATLMEMNPFKNWSASPKVRDEYGYMQHGLAMERAAVAVGTACAPPDGLYVQKRYVDYGASAGGVFPTTDKKILFEPKIIRGIANITDSDPTQVVPTIDHHVEMTDAVAAIRYVIKSLGLGRLNVSVV